MRKNALRRTPGARWPFLFSLIVLLSGCGRPAAEIPMAGGNARENVAVPPESQPRAQEALAAEPRPPAIVPSMAAQTGALATAPNTSEVPGRKRSPGMETEDGSLPADVPASTPAGADTLERQLAALEVPPPWLEGVSTKYDTSLPWKDARLEIRRLLSLNTDAARKEAIKLTWIYLQKGDIGDGHEYPMYIFLGGEPVWAVRAHEEFLAKPHDPAPDHAYISLASLYARFDEFEKAEATLNKAMAKLPAPPWRIARQANLHEAFGDLYVAWGKTELARQNYAEAIRLYPTSDQPYGQHLLKRQADRTQSKVDLLSFRSLAGALLREGRYTSVALGYAGDIQVSLTVRDGRMADIQVKHEEKIDQGACVLIPQRILDKQSLQVDAITGATVTTNAIIDGALQCLRKAGLQ